MGVPSLTPPAEWAEASVSPPLVTSLDMASGLTEEQKEIQALASSFAMNELFPNMAAWDQGEVFPVETLKAAAALGFGAVYTSAEYGGTGLSRFEASLVFEALAQGRRGPTGCH